MDNEFSVWWWDRDGGQHEELRFVDAERAIDRCKTLTHGPAAVMEIVHRVIVTDGGDRCVLEWKINEGIVFPLRWSFGHATENQQP